MTIQRLRFRLRKLREHGEELREEGGEINLVPYLDIVMNLIMFLLATVTFSASLSSININLPTSSTQVASAWATSPRYPTAPAGLRTGCRCCGPRASTPGG